MTLKSANALCLRVLSQKKYHDSHTSHSHIHGTKFYERAMSTGHVNVSWLTHVTHSCLRILSISHVNVLCLSATTHTRHTHKCCTFTTRESVDEPCQCVVSMCHDSHMSHIHDSGVFQRVMSTSHVNASQLAYVTYPPRVVCESFRKKKMVVRDTYVTYPWYTCHVSTTCVHHACTYRPLAYTATLDTHCVHRPLSCIATHIHSVWQYKGEAYTQVSNIKHMSVRDTYVTYPHVSGLYTSL